MSSPHRPLGLFRLCALLALALIGCLSAPAQTVINYGDTWKFHVPATDPGTTWRTLAFNDSSWSAGPGLFGYETAVMPAPGMQTAVGAASTPPITYLFRKTFNYSGSTSGVTYAIDQVVDDGVTYYLNGNLLGSIRHTPGAWDNVASAGVGDAVEEMHAVLGSATGLINGLNVLTAEVHQVAANGSDLVFGARLRLNTAPMNSDDWRLLSFNTASNTGNAADTADADKDGLTNLAEYALNEDPNHTTTAWANTAVAGANLTFHYTRRKAALAELTFDCQWSTSPTGTWSNTGVTEQILSDDGTLQSVRAQVALSGNAKLFFRIVMTRAAGAPPTVTISTPTSRCIYQRNNSNQGSVPIRGTCSAGTTRVDARLVVRTAGQGITTNWITIDSAPTGGTYRGMLPGTGGWYQLEVRALAGATVGNTTPLDRVGIGEIFAISGHSVAHGQGINIAGATDDRVNCVPYDKASPAHLSYKQTADMQYLQSAFGHYGDETPTSGTCPEPFGNGTYFWSKFAETVAQRTNVPVMIYNAGFGGTNLEQWYKASQGIFFEHSFVNANIRMPYINLYNVLKKYAPMGGMRAVLCDHGQNDAPNNDENQLFGYYTGWVTQARTDIGFNNLAMVINRQTPYISQPGGSVANHIRRVQQRMIDTYPNCYTGPDYDLMNDSSSDPNLRDRADYIHLSAPGQPKAATWWADAITNGSFLTNSTPFIPSSYP